jgi:hypothetical protein
MVDFRRTPELAMPTIAPELAELAGVIADPGVPASCRG